MSIHLHHRLLVCLTAIGCLGATPVHSQTSGHHFVKMVQGQEVPIPEDYIGKYEMQKKELLVTLDSLGAEASADEDVTVVLVHADGRTESQKAGADGQFVFNNVTSGLASFVVTGSQGTYGAMAVFLDAVTAPLLGAPSPNAAELPAASPAPLRIPTIAKVDKSEIKRAVNVSGFGTQGAAVKPISFYKPGPASRFQVKLVNGVLQGKVVVPEDGYEQQPGSFNVTIMKNGSVAGATVSDADGNFNVRLNSSGTHSIIAAGPSGHVAFSFEVVDGGQTARLGWQSTIKMVARLPEPGEVLYVLVIPPRMMTSVRKVVNDAFRDPTLPPIDPSVPPAFAPGFPGGYAGGGFGGGAAGGGGFGGLAGGSGGGGGGLGGLSGIGPLLGIGGLAAGVAALASDDDGFNSVPASIIVP